METIYDWVTLALFAGLIVLFLQRSALSKHVDKLRDYLIAAAGFAAVNQIGNHGYHVFAILGLAAVLAFIQITLRPFSKVEQ